MWNKLSPRQMFHRFSRGLVQASAVIGYFEVSSQMKICGPHSSVILSAFAHTDLFTQRCPYTQTLSHTDAFTHRRFYFYTQTLLQPRDYLHADTFTQTRLHTNIFTHKHFYTQTLLHTEAFTHRRYYTQTLLHAKSLHTNSFTHKHFYTETLLHTEAFTHRRYYTHRRFYTQTLLHTDAFTHIAILLQFLGDPTSFRAKGTCERVARDKLKSQFYLSFCRSNLISVRKGCAGQVEIAILPQFLTIEPHFRCETVHRKHEIVILPQFLTIEPHFVRKGCAGQVDIAILPQFLTIEPHFRAKGLRGTRWNRNFTAVFGDRTSFRAKGLRGTSWNRNFTSVFGDRTSISCETVHPETRNRNFTSIFDDRTSFSCEKVARDKLKSQFYFSFWRSEPHFVRKGCAGQVEIAILPQFLTIEPRRAKGLRGTSWNRNFTSVFGDRTSFRAKGLRFVPSRCHCPLLPPSRKK